MIQVDAHAPVSMLMLADSEVSRVTHHGDDWLLSFSAASCTHTTHTSKGAQTLAGYMLAVELLCSYCEVREFGEACLGRISKGRLIAEGVALRGLPVHQTLNGNLVLEVEFANGSVLELSAQRIQLCTTGATRFMESLAC